MKRITILLLLVALALPVWADNLYQDQAIQDDQNSGPLDITGHTSASYTVPIPAESITDIGAYIPGHAKGVEFHAWGSDIIINDDDCISTATIFVGSKISSGSSRIWTGLKNGAKNFHAAPYGTSAATMTLVVW